MPPQTPHQKCSIVIPGLGQIDGYEFENGVRQFCGVPYATLSKRWTRSTLRTSLENAYHDGTRLGSRCPHPEFEGDDGGELVPVPPFPHFNIPIVDELSALVMNIVLPPVTSTTRTTTTTTSDLGDLPIFVYVHGGSLLYGGANLAIFDGVNFVSQAVAEQKPLVAINFNYRVGLGGFLASEAIRDELIKDEYAGCGNFGFTDQQVAFEWVQKYGGFLGGDITNVTAVGESAGGISISNQLLAANPPIFHRAVCMSGLACAIPAWTMKQHQDLFDTTCRHFKLDPNSKNVMDQLRSIPEQALANAFPQISGVPAGTGNPCLDDTFYRQDPRETHLLPTWLKSYMLGDVYHEGVIFHLNIMFDTYDFWRATFLDHLENDETLVDQIFELYDISAQQPKDKLIQNFEHMAGDAIFKIPNYLTAKLNQQRCNGEKQTMFLYHFDQRSRIKNSFEGTAYHAHELLYLFRNLEEEMSAEERQMGENLARAWINFAHGQNPWPEQVCKNTTDEQPQQRLWKIWGPDSQERLLYEAQDEETRGYVRFEKMLNIGGEPGQTWKKWFRAIDSIVNKRMRLGKGLALEYFN